MRSARNPARQRAHVLWNHLGPIVDDAFLLEHREVSVELTFDARVVNLVDEGYGEPNPPDRQFELDVAARLPRRRLCRPPKRLKLYRPYRGTMPAARYKATASPQMASYAIFKDAHFLVKHHFFRAGFAFRRGGPLTTSCCESLII